VNAVDERFFYSLEGPLDAMPARGQIRAGNFQGFPEFVRRCGADPRSILERYGMDPASIADPDSYIDCKGYVEVFEYCGSLLEDPLFGLRLARLQEPDVLGCVSTLCRAAPNLREAIQCFIDYIGVLHAPGTTVQLVEGDEVAEFRYDALRTDIGFHDQSNYHAMLLTMKLLRQIGGRDFRPTYATLTVDARARDVADIEDALGCRYRRSTTNAIAFPTRALDRPVANSNRLLFRLLSGYLDRVKAAARTGISQRVEDYVLGSLQSGNCSIERCAKKLGISERSLQLHMNDSGIRFSDVVQQQRARLSKSYLKLEDLSLDEVASLLGYSEQSSFGRAFRRWTGSTPQRYRVEQLRPQRHPTSPRRPIQGSRRLGG
jgi:AraC-like DNA-binding protein